MTHELLSKWQIYIEKQSNKIRSTKNIRFQSPTNRISY
jgi:hypothetical protein